MAVRILSIWRHRALSGAGNLEKRLETRAVSQENNLNKHYVPWTLSQPTPCMSVWVFVTCILRIVCIFGVQQKEKHNWVGVLSMRTWSPLEHRVANLCSACAAFDSLQCWAACADILTPSEAMTPMLYNAACGFAFEEGRGGGCPKARASSELHHVNMMQLSD